MLIHHHSLPILSFCLLLTCCAEKSNNQNEVASSKDLFSDANLILMTKDIAIAMKMNRNKATWKTVLR